DRRTPMLALLRCDVTRHKAAHLMDLLPDSFRQPRRPGVEKPVKTGELLREHLVDPADDVVTEQFRRFDSLKDVRRRVIVPRLVVGGADPNEIVDRRPLLAERKGRPTGV